MDELSKIEVNPPLDSQSSEGSSTVSSPSFSDSSDIPDASQPVPSKPVQKKNGRKIWNILGTFFLIFLIIGGILAIIGWKTYGES